MTPSWLDRAVDEALAVCPTMQPWEVRVMLIAAAPTIQNAATEALRADLAGEIEAMTSAWDAAGHSQQDHVFRGDAARLVRASDD